MTPDELRALADALCVRHYDLATVDVIRAADYLRACADAKPVAWMHDGFVSTDYERVQHDEMRNRSCGFKAKPILALYTHPAPATPHSLYKTGDPDTPKIVQDRNGEVVLAQCRRCGLGEAELDQPCLPQADVQPVAWLYRDWANVLKVSQLDPHEDGAFAVFAAPQPQAEPNRAPLSEEQMRAVLIAEARRIAVQAGEKDPDSLTLDEEMLAQVMLAGRAVERAHGIGGSDAE